MSGPPPLDYGAIGNGRLIALVSPSTAIEWLCLPRFDSPSVFGSLLDRERGGWFGFETDATASHRMEYVANTNVLRTEVRCASGVFDVFDFAPRIPDGLRTDSPLEIHRLLVPRAGRPRLRVHFDPRPDYARARPELLPHGRGVEVIGGPLRLHLKTSLPAAYILNGSEVAIERPHWLVLSAGRPTEIDSLPAAERALDLTIAGWRAWAKTCALPSFGAAEVLRSALCLKLHVFEDTGAIIAASTASLPEALGTSRTWDYRYCWLRDAAFVVEALRRLSHLAEGEAFVRFLRHVAEAACLQPVYGVGGERELTEEHLDHLAGYGGARPVRVGNAAHAQRQHDLVGEIVLCLETILTDPRVIPDDPEGHSALLERLVEQSIRDHPHEDTGIWEFRSLLRHYTFSKVMGWAAADRGARLAARLGRRDLAGRWTAWARAEAPRILEGAWNEKLGFFTQALGGSHPDAANLLLPTIGILDARDPRFVSTVRAYERLLVANGLMLRYRNPDDFGETTSAFTVCSFWWAEALAMMGELDRAADLFRRLVALANPVGLLSEDVDPSTGRLLGNFPQAYTHVGLIHAACTIGELLEARDARFRAWS